MNKYEVRSTSSETMSVNPIVLRENQATRLVFYPVWVETSENPLRGGFRFQRKGPSETWEDFDSKSLSCLHKDEEYKLNLKGEEIVKLFENLEDIKSVLNKFGFSYGDRSFLISKKNIEGVFLQIGDVGKREWIVEQLKKLESDNFENLGSVIGRAKLENVIEEFEYNIENKDENFWQEFFEEKSWILQQVFAFPVVYLNGESYVGGKNSKGRSGSGGCATDFLFKNGSNGSFAVVEIKTPSCELIGSCYRGKSGSGDSNELYKIHGDLTGGIVQMENQICTAVEYFNSVIGRDYKDLNHLNPTGVLIAGCYSKMTSHEQKSFELFRKSLGKNQVYTFDEVLEKLKILKTVYEE